MNPIDILSSDSENEIDVGSEKGSMVAAQFDAPDIHRQLPAWASTPSSNSKVTGATSSRESHIDNDRRPWLSHHKRQSSDDKQISKNHIGTVVNDPKPASSSSNYGEQVNGVRGNEAVNSNSAVMIGNDLGKFSSPQALRRNLPSSFRPSSSTTLQPSLSTTPRPSSSTALGSSSSTAPQPSSSPALRLSSSTAKGNSSYENGVVGHIFNARGNSHHSVGTNAADEKVYTKGHLCWEDNDEVTMYEHHGGRLLPPSLNHGKSLAKPQPSASIDPIHRSGLEERPAERDEQLIFQAALETLQQPKLEATLPNGLLQVSLLRHQKIALAWMFQRETRSYHCLGGFLADDQGLGKTISTIALILLQKHLLSKDSKPTSVDLHAVKKTEALNLDDDDDVSELNKEKQTGVPDGVEKIPKVTTAVPPCHKGKPDAGTLVVCPASVLRQWARELEEKVTDGAKLSVLVYHGGARTKDPVELAKYDVVLTTYSIVCNEVPKQAINVGDNDDDEDDDDAEDLRNGEDHGLSSEFRFNKKRKKPSNAGKKGRKGKKKTDNSLLVCGGTLARVRWFRVVLDEAQTIKNHRTQVARACCGLRAKRRWCLSGTPIQNSVEDLYSYFRFLKYDPYAKFQSFCSSIKYPIGRNAVNGYKKLQAILKTIMLRRTKGSLIDGKPIINLPPKTVHLIKVDFSMEERAFYSKLEADSRSQFKAYAAAGTLRQNYANILIMLLRLRQACDHPILVKGYTSDSVGHASSEMARRLPKDMLINLLNLLEASVPICGVCNDPAEDAVVTMGGHVFCYQCVSDYLTGDDNTCPAPGCKEQLGTDVVFSKHTLRTSLSGEHDGNASSSFEVALSSQMHNMYGSSKIRAAIEILEKHCNTPSFDTWSGVSSSSDRTNLPGGPFKAIVFSQWTSMLDLVEVSLNHSCIQYRRFDGTMTLAARDRAVKDFNNDPEVVVMLMSLKAGNLGLNLVAACHVILLDLWWNPTTEDQAIDRAHRIGQTRPVTVSRLTIKDTVEDRILALQEQKRKMVSSAFGEDQKGGTGARLTVEDLRYLFMV
ncbi:hypothetical protein Sjap_014443 [Stephania japonica]|uniref:Helicase-like transcription factor CHR28 n=1 Tax=Stephania japonica TaxID=461633 RepID=A0AAP0NT14_9MAGN